MNKIIFFIILYINISSAFFLPDDVQVKLGTGYNSNFLNFSDYEINNLSNDILVLGDSDTYDSPVIRCSVRSSREIKFIPIILDLDMGFINYSQSSNKTSFNSSFIVSHRFGNYKWIKLGYKNIPMNYLRMYKDRDQIGSPLVAADFKFERLFSSISFPIYRKIWVRTQFSRALMYFNKYFTEFDLIQNQLYVKVYNLAYRRTTLSPFIKILSSDNNTYGKGLLSNNIDRSYIEYIFGNDFKRKIYNNIFFDNYKTIVSFKLRNYTSLDLVDVLHNNRSHIEFEFIHKISKNINENINISMYCKYVNRKTDASSDYVEDLKSYNNFEFGFDFLFNLTDKLYDITY